MPHVRFLQLATPEKDQIVCQITERHYLQGERVLIRAIDEAHALALDTLLWTFQSESFLPHAVLTEDTASAPILVTHRDLFVANIDILILAAESPLDVMCRYPIVIDFAETHNPDVRQKSRERYQRWKDAGYPPQYEKS